MRYGNTAGIKSSHRVSQDMTITWIVRDGTIPHRVYVSSIKLNGAVKFLISVLEKKGVFFRRDTGR
jgi:hypothetical protein